MESKKAGLAAIVGQGKVFDSPELLDGYSRDISFRTPLKPWFVVKPGNPDEIQKIVMWANETRTPLIPVSSGQPHFNGDTVPTAAGAIIVDLSGMKHIVRIDHRNRMAMIEPGVTFSQLQPELAKEGLRVSTPLLPRSNKSVIASLLERQPTLIPKYNYSLPEPLRSLEVVWGYGQKMWTGDAGSKPGTIEKQWEMKLAQVNPHGPGNIDFYRLLSAAQGSMGVVTQAAIKCEILPQIHKLLLIPSQKLDNLIDFAYRILRLRFGDEIFILNDTCLASVLGEVGKKEEFPAWLMLIGVAGRALLPEIKVDAQEKDIEEIARPYGLQLASAVSGSTPKQILNILLNLSREPYWKLGYKGNAQDIFFLTTLDKTPEFVKIMSSQSDIHQFAWSDVGIYIQPQLQGTICHCEFSLPFNPSNSVERAKVQNLYKAASEALMKQGAYFSRPYGIWADMVYSRDANSSYYLKKLKDIFDPNHIMNPGKLCF